MKKRLISLALVALILISLSACGGSPPQSGAQAGAAQSGAQSGAQAGGSAPSVGATAFEQANAELEAAIAPLPEKGTGVKIGAIESTLANSFWITMQEGYEDAAAEWGVEVDVMATESETDIQGQLNIMSDMLVKDYAAIAVSPLTEQNMIPGIAQANQSGVAVVAVGNGVNEEAMAAAGASIAAFITSDFKAQGALGAEFVIAKNGGAGKVAVIEGIPGATQSDARRDGALETFAAAGLEVLPVQTGNFDRQTSYDLMSALIDANPDLAGVTCGNDVMALGVVEALKDKNMLDKVTVVGVDFIEEAKASIEAGELDASVAMSPYLFGKAGLLCALKAIEGHEFPEAVIWTPLSLVSAENVAGMDGWK
ncbi:MAG: substrate-binding domain-containing protein [Peptococcaceae bacterium]|nr:substrate-binding domain-containing protein [Peptococcaceae bacterium]